MLVSLLNKVIKFSVILAVTFTLDASAAKIRVVEIEGGLERYYAEFKSIYETICGHSIAQLIPPSGVVIKMAPLKQKIIGQCEHYGSRFIIKFSPSYWNGYDDLDKRAVFWHEALHCFFQEDHRNDPTHFMNPYYKRITQELLNRQLVEYIKAHCEYRQD